MKKLTTEELNVVDITEKVICKEFNIRNSDFESKNSTANVSLARGFLFYILHKDYKISVGKIAEYYFREPRTIFWNISKIDFLIKQRVYKEIYEKVSAQIK